MGAGRLVAFCLVVWAAFASLVVCWTACGGGFGVQDARLGWPLFLVGLIAFLCTGFGVPLRAMAMVRLESLSKTRGVLIVLLSSVVSAIAPPLMVTLSVPRHAVDGTDLGAGFSAALMALGTVAFGIIAFVGFTVGIVFINTKTNPEPNAQGRPSQG
jgi:hypothetical protein